MTRKTHSIHHLHFIILLLILTLGAAAILLAAYQPQLQIIFVMATAFSYFLWGLLHHHKQRDLHKEIVIEYLLIAIFGATLLISIILKA